MSDEEPCRICGFASSYLTPEGNLCEAHAVLKTPGFVVTCNRLGEPPKTTEIWNE